MATEDQVLPASLTSPHPVRNPLAKRSGQNDGLRFGDCHRSRAFPWRQLLVLFKLREVALLLFAGVGAAFLAAGGWPGSDHLTLLLATGGVAAAGASAINQYLERDLDGRMERTRRRPLVTKAISRPGWVPWVGAAMILGPSLAVLPVNPALGVFVMLGAAIYIGIYTAWLKPRTLLNVIIGGLAGSAAVLSGSAAAGRWNDPGALLLALLVFLWTPTHFWSLAIAHRDDYARGGFPMLPVLITARVAAGWVLFHTVATVCCALALLTHPAMGWIYGIPAGLAGAVLIVHNLRLVADPGADKALALFHTSNLYLAVVILMICVDALVA